MQLNGCVRGTYEHILLTKQHTAVLQVLMMTRSLEPRTRLLALETAQQVCTLLPDARPPLLFKMSFTYVGVLHSPSAAGGAPVGRILVAAARDADIPGGANRGR